jgi:hypothetical protein
MAYDLRRETARFAKRNMRFVFADFCPVEGVNETARSASSILRSAGDVNPKAWLAATNRLPGARASRVIARSAPARRGDPEQPSLPYRPWNASSP